MMSTDIKINHEGRINKRLSAFSVAKMGSISLTSCLVLATSDAFSGSLTDIEFGTRPRIDYLDLQHRLNADLIDFGVYQRPPYRWLERGDRLSRLAWGQALFALRHWRDYQLVYSLSEDVGLAMAFLLRLRGRRPRHVMVAHNLLSPRKVPLTRRMGVMDRFDAIVVLSSAAAAGICATYGVGPERVIFLMDAIDETFWRPDPDAVVDPGLILSVGRARRDYATLLAAVDGLPARLRVQAGSQWHVEYAAATGRSSLPANVELGEFLPYAGLRALYDRAAFVVIALERDAHHSAGSVSIKEAMAMGKAVIVAADGGVGDAVRHGETGLVVPAADPALLRQAIVRLLDDPAEATRMGRAGRAVLEREMRYEDKIDRLVALATA